MVLAHSHGQYKNNGTIFIVRSYFYDYYTMINRDLTPVSASISAQAISPFGVVASAATTTTIDYCLEFIL